jgi:hypothetical protein
MAPSGQQGRSQPSRGLTQAGARPHTPCMEYFERDIVERLRKWVGPHQRASLNYDLAAAANEIEHLRGRVEALQGDVRYLENEAAWGDGLRG